MKPAANLLRDRKHRSLVVLLLTALTAAAQAFGAQAPEERRYQWHIERQSLGAALREVGRQTGLQVAGFTEAMDSVALVGPVDGVMSVHQALQSLLAPGGLTYRIINEHMIAIVPASQRAEPPRGQRGAAHSPSAPDHGAR